MVKKKETQQTSTHVGLKIFVVAIILGMLFLTSTIFAFIIGLFLLDDSAVTGTGNVALIPVYGVISTSSDAGGFLGSQIATSADIVNFINLAEKNDNIKALVIEINSPGGSPVATDEIAQAISKTTKPTVAWIREVGASGGYWVATATDHIIANKMSLTGSVGVIASYLEFDGLMHDYNVTYRRYVSGKYKDLGSPYKEATEMEQYLFQQKLDILHNYFKEQVQERRELSEEQIDDIASGIFYIGAEAFELGLVDELGGEYEVVMYLNTTYNITAGFVRYEKKTTLFDELFGIMEHVGIGIGKGIRPGIQEQGVTIRY